MHKPFLLLVLITICYQACTFSRYRPSNKVQFRAKKFKKETSLFILQEHCPDTYKEIEEKYATKKEKKETKQLEKKCDSIRGVVAGLVIGTLQKDLMVKHNNKAKYFLFIEDFKKPDPEGSGTAVLWLFTLGIFPYFEIDEYVLRTKLYKGYKLIDTKDFEFENIWTSSWLYIPAVLIGAPWSKNWSNGLWHSHPEAIRNSMKSMADSIAKHIKERLIREEKAQEASS